MVVAPAAEQLGELGLICEQHAEQPREAVAKDKVQAGVAAYRRGTQQLYHLQLGRAAYVRAAARAAVHASDLNDAQWRVRVGACSVP